ncbi:Type II secretion system protein E [Tepidimonas sediminis]|uniref:Type II secretion system protein E n=1 Tax=Tepidimonas sediminis TaxID=2588941 RepID=A0A554WMM5_9BURK|nr:GspE/PulE family protein [Tepidimonas sediminis]TSE24823.1 Type II secretion system protein E [Tepidimonas sediminis]
MEPSSAATAQTHPQPRTPAELWSLLDSPDGQTLRARHVGEALLHLGLIDERQLREALQAQREERRLGLSRPLGELLVERGAITETQLRQAIAAWLGNRVVDPTHYQFDPAALALVPRVVAERESVLPLALRGDELVMLMADTLDQALLDELRFMTQRRIVPVLAAAGTLPAALARAYDQPAAPAVAGKVPLRPGAPGRPKPAARELLADLQQASDIGTEQQADIVSESDNTLVRLVHTIIEEAIAQKASDIHIETEPPPKPVRVRLRIDGELVKYLEIESRFRYALVARIKIMAGMDISEHRKPQDGKIDFARFGGPRTELRVVTVPTTGGLEDVVLRLLAGSKPMPIDSIGLAPRDLAALRRMALKPYGLILVCGPTGSGKTTTLHSLIADINTENRKIWTAEDPIEITQPGLRQVQMNPRIGWTFAAAMRTFLRADPDVIMIGEMRDEETARIAVEASLTGHLVLSTLHTNSAPESITRLLEIGLDPFNFSDSLLAILAQRLVRRLCRQCVQARPATDDELEALATHYLESCAAPGERLDVAGQIERWRAQYGVEEGGRRILRTYVKHGCPACEGRGYKGRLGIYELMLSDDTIRHHIRHRASAGEIRASALAAGMRTLRQDGIEKVLAGLTDLAEVIAATNV